MIVTKRCEIGVLTRDALTSEEAVNGFTAKFRTAILSSADAAEEK